MIEILYEIVKIQQSLINENINTWDPSCKEKKERIEELMQKLEKLFESFKDF